MTVTYNQKGYVGSSMSVRAREAYDRGERPLSKWTKKAMMAELGRVLDGDTDMFDDFGTTPEEMTALPKTDILDALGGLPKRILLGEWLVRTSWHHTSKYANETDFLYPDIDRLHHVVAHAIGQGGDVRAALMDDAERWSACHCIDWQAGNGRG